MTLWTVLVLFIAVLQLTTSSPLPAEESIADLGKSIDHFSVAFLKKLTESNGDENIFFSPLGIQVAYSMLLKGAQGETEKQIRSTLHLDKSFVNSELIHEAYRKLLARYVGPESVLRIANLMALNKKLVASVKPEYVDSVRGSYKSQVWLEDFSHGEQLMNKVNSWVANQTDNYITQILSQPVDERVPMYLANSVYFKDYWEHKFYPSSFKKFQNIDNTTSHVDFMENYDVQNYWNSGGEVRKLELPFERGVSMVVLLPEQRGGIRNLVSSLTQERLNDLMQRKHWSWVEVKMPRFFYETNYDLVQHLKAMGMERPFAPGLAEFSGITETPAYVAESLQKSKIDVHTDGASAASVTTIWERLTSGIETNHRPTEFTVDHPFIFLIRDVPANMTLFVGVVNKLSK